MVSDLEAIKAIDRLAFAWSQNPDVIALKPWIAAHCGLNPHAAGPLDPDSAVVAECERLRAKVADLQDKLAAAAARLQVADTKLGEARSRAKVAKNEAKKERNKRLRRDNAAQSPDNEAAQVAKDKRNAYMRELMRRKRSKSREAAAPSDTGGQPAPAVATPAADLAADG